MLRLRCAPSWCTATVLGFALASLFSDMGHELVTSLLPGFFLSLGAPPLALGVLEGVSNLAANVASAVGGSLADTLPRRRPWLAVGYLGTTLKALLALTSSWGVAVGIRTLGWIFRGLRGPLRDTVIAEQVKEGDRGKAYGLREAMDTVGAVVGPLGGAALLPLLGTRALLAISAIPGLLSVAVVLAMVRDGPRPVRQHASPWQHYPAAFWRYLLAASVFAVGNVAPTFYVWRATTLLETRHGLLSATALGVALYALHNLFYAVGALPGGALADRLGAPRLLAVGYALSILASAGFALGPRHLLGLLPLFALSGTATSLIATLQSTWAATLLPASVRGSGLGLQAALVGTGNLISGLGMGVLWTLLGPTTAFLLAAAVAAAGTGLLLSRPAAAT